MVSLAFRAGKGITVFRYRAEGDSWKTLARISEKIEIGKPRRFVVEVGDDKIQLSLDDGPVHAVDVSGIDLTGAWGVGVQASGAGIWSGVKED